MTDVGLVLVMSHVYHLDCGDLTLAPENETLKCV